MGLKLGVPSFPTGKRYTHYSVLLLYDNHDRKVNGSTPNLASLLRPWIRCFTMIISAWWSLASSKLKKSEAKFNRKTGKQRQLLSESGFVLRIAPPSLSRDRIKMKKSKKKIYRNLVLHHGSCNSTYKIVSLTSWKFKSIFERHKWLEFYINRRQSIEGHIAV